MIKGAIFDMDGVISDTQNLHASTEADLLKEYGIDITPEEISENYGGMLDREFFKTIFKKHGVLADTEIVFNRKWERMVAITTDNITPIPGAIKIIYSSEKAGLKLAVASSAPARFIEIVLSGLKIREKFETTVSGDDVKHGKPDPEIFLLAAKKLNIKPQECVVIEDSYAGMVAAKKADMKCIGLVKENNKQYPADLIINSLEDLTAEKIQKIVEKGDDQFHNFLANF